MERNVLIAGLIFSCPINKDSPTCPFIEIRMMSIWKRVDYINTLNAEQLMNLEMQHNKCYKESFVIRQIAKTKND